VNNFKLCSHLGSKWIYRYANLLFYNVLPKERVVDNKKDTTIAYILLSDLRFAMLMRMPSYIRCVKLR
jgi:hypothetical protein